MITINRNPGAKDLRVFAALLILFVLTVSALAKWRFDSPVWGMRILYGGLALVLVYLLVPRLRRYIYLGWMFAAFPIGWVVSHLLLATIFYLILTPIGLLLRLMGKDLMRSRPQDVASYWEAHNPGTDSSRYFRQY